jgi:hypothetical protein
LPNGTTNNPNDPDDHHNPNYAVGNYPGGHNGDGGGNTGKISCTTNASTGKINCNGNNITAAEVGGQF